MKKICMKRKKLLSILLVIVMALLCLSSCASNNTNENANGQQNTETEIVKNKVIRLSTTTSVNDSGVLPYLQPFFEEETGYKLEITSAGTGAAIEKGNTGDADCLLVHAKSKEEDFINSGYGVERVELMYNYFVIVGPKQDLAKVSETASASDAFKAIANSDNSFVSRGDESGTNTAELKIWDNAGINPVGQKWYVSTGQGMGASINVASEQQAYIFTDKATYLSHELKDTLCILLEESDDLKNTYSMIAVNPEKWPDTNIEGANAFIQWMKSDKAKNLIIKYGVEEYGQQLFYID